MIQLTTLNNIVTEKNGKEFVAAKNIKTKVWIHKEDICHVSELWNLNTKSFYKTRCVVHVKEIGDLIVVKRINDILKEINKPIIHGFRRR